MIDGFVYWMGLITCFTVSAIFVIALIAIAVAMIIDFKRESFRKDFTQEWIDDAILMKCRKEREEQEKGTN